MSFVTLENFHKNIVVLGKMYCTTKPMSYKILPIQYKYLPSCTRDLIILTPRLESQDVYENKERTTQVLNGYSIGLKIASSDGDSQFYDFLLEVTEIIKSKIETLEDSLKKTRKVGVNTENLEIVKYKDDGSVVTYPKLYTDNNMAITSTFYRVATQSEVNEGLASRGRPIIPVKATDYLNTSIVVVVGIRIAGEYLDYNLETIRLRVSGVIVYPKIPIESISSKNLGIIPITNEDDDSNDEDYVC